MNKVTVEELKEFYKDNWTLMDQFIAVIGISFLIIIAATAGTDIREEIVSFQMTFDIFFFCLIIFTWFYFMRMNNKVTVSREQYKSMEISMIYKLLIRSTMIAVLIVEICKAFFTGMAITIILMFPAEYLPMDFDFIVMRLFDIVHLFFAVYLMYFILTMSWKEFWVHIVRENSSKV